MGKAYNAGIDRLQGNMPTRLCATPLIAPILAHFWECLLHLLYPSWHKVENRPFSVADPNPKESAPCSRVDWIVSFLSKSVTSKLVYS